MFEITFIMLKDFLAFLKEYKIVPLAAAFVIGTASTSLVGSLVNDIIMPIVAPLLSGTAWKDAVLNLGPVHIAYGSFLGQLLNFLILAFVVFLIVKKLIKEEKKVA